MLIKMEFPFAFISGKGLGISHSSDTKLSAKFKPLNTFGSAKLKCAINAANGNLYVRDHSLILTQAVGSVELAFHYNSLAQTPWQLGLRKLIVPLSANVITLQESDGHEVTYTFDALTNTYQADSFTVGRPFIEFDAANHSWIRVHPGKETKECFASNGQLSYRVDKNLSPTGFLYDAQDNLQTIVCPNGIRYDITRTQQTNGTQIEIDRIEKGKTTPIQIYQLDTANRLTASKTADGYVTEYEYQGNIITRIKQSDATSLLFKPDENNTNLIEMLTVGEGKEANQYSIQYPDDSQNTAIILCPNNDQYSVTFNNNAQLTQFAVQSNLSPTADMYEFDYDNNGQLRSAQDAAKNVDLFTYDAEFNLLEQHITADGEEIHYYYSNDKLPLLITEAHSLQNNATQTWLAHRYVYETATAEGFRLLRFEVSPLGRVKEYRYDGSKLKQILTYKDALFQANAPLDQELDLNSLCAFVNARPATEICLTDVTENLRGQIIEQKKYAKLDQNGDGILDDQASVETFVWNDANQLLKKTTRQDVNISATESQQYDLLSRITGIQNDLNKTIYVYDDANKTATTIYQNARERIVTHDTTAAIQSEREIAQNSMGQTEEHLTVIQRNNTEVEIKIAPDGKKTAYFYDAYHELRYVVSATGIVTEYNRDREKNFSETIHYETAIDVQAFYAGEISTRNLLSFLQPNETGDRKSLKFYDAANRIILAVDEDNYVTQPLYDCLHRDTGTLQFRDKISSATITLLKQQGPNAWDTSNLKYKLSRKFYDADGLLIAQSDKAGYITQYLRDAAGFITERIVYSQKVTTLTPDTSFADIDCNNLPIYAHHYYFRDARGQVTLEVDAEGFITTHDYYANGLKKSLCRFEQKVDPNWYANTSILPQAVSSKNDKTTYYVYDLLGREILQSNSDGKAIATTYDDMNHVAATQIYDAFNSATYDADAKRQTYKRYDGFGNVSAELNLRAGEMIACIDAENLPEPEKQIKREAVWQQYAIRYVRNVMGIVTQSSDALGNVSYFYYDDERRLIATIDPTGAVTQKSYDTHDNCVTLRIHKQRLAQTILQTLTGGTVDTAFMNLLENNFSPNDSVENYVYDARHLVETKTDAEGNISQFTYDEDGKLATEFLPVATKNPSLTIIHTREERGLETGLSKTAANISIHIEHVYDNPQGLVTETTDENEVTTTYQYDALNRLNAVETDDRKVDYLRDAFDRIVQEKDAQDNITTHDYDDQNRTHTIISPDQKSVEINKTNVFGETICKTNALNESQTFVHAPDGQVTQYSDALQQIATHAYDIQGNKLSECNVANSVTTYDYNAASQLICKTSDAGRTNLATNFEPNVFGQNEKITAANNVSTVNSYDRCQNLTNTISDPVTALNPKGLNISSSYQVNAQGKKIHMTVGDQQNADQYQQQIQRDALGRDIGTVVDPGGLSITREKILDDAGQCIAELDANGKKTYLYYNAHRELIYTITSDGRALEYQYNNLGQKILERDYASIINTQSISEQSSLSDIQAILSLNKNETADGVKYFFYDENGREKFIINVLSQYDSVNKAFNYTGVVTQRNYDATSREIATISYAQTINASQLSQLKTADIAASVNANDPNNLVVYSIYDAKGRQRFKIRQDGKIHETRYDALDHAIVEVSYATLLPTAINISTLTEVQMQVELKNLKCINDRFSYRIYDTAGRLTHDINPEGGVTRRVYDNVNNILASIQFKNPLSIINHDDYATIASQANALLVNENKDSVNKFHYDTANRLVSATDALKHEETFVYDALGQTLSHSNRNKNTWQYQYDRAKRLMKEISPQTRISHIDRNPATSQLQETTDEIHVVKIIESDKENNVIKITEGSGLLNARTSSMTYNDQKQMTQSAIIHVAVDDALQTANMIILPVTLQTVTTQIMYNGRKQKIAEKNENNFGQYYVYDSLGRLIYEINHKGKVTATVYNALNQVTSVTEYATGLNVDLSAYITTGVPVKIIVDNLKTCSADRKISFQYDKAGNVNLIQRDKVYCYTNGVFNLASPTVYKKYNAFGELVQNSVLMSTGVWATNFIWYNRAGKILAEIDELLYLTLYSRDQFGKEITRVEYATALTQVPDINADASTFKYLTTPSVNDRSYQTGYDLLGRKTAEIMLNACYQNLTLGANTIPQVADVYAAVSKTFVYDAMGHLISTTYEDGSAEYKFYDERGYQIAASAVKRTPFNFYPACTPLTTYGIDAFGKTVRVTQHINSVTITDPTQLPLIVPDVQDHTRLEWFDNRGLKVISQDSEYNLTAYTYTAHKKIARKIALKKFWQNLGAVNAPQFIQNTAVDEERFIYGLEEEPLQHFMLLDNKAYSVTCYAYTIFNECSAQGPDFTNWQIRQFYDNTGVMWLSNVTGSAIITLHDLANNETLSWQSKDINLSACAYTQIPSLFNVDTTTLERTEKVFDMKRRLISIKAPDWDENNHGIPSHLYYYDRWGNVTEEYDSFGYHWTRYYNFRNQQTFLMEPETLAVFANHTQQRLRPWTKTSYNIRGFHVASTNTESFTEAFCRDTAGQMIMHVLADGTKVESNIYNIFGNLTQSYSAANYPLTYSFNRLNQVTSLIHRDGAVQSYQRDADNNILYMTSRNGDGYRFSYLNGDIISRFLPLGDETHLFYDHNHLVIKEIRAIGTFKKWDRNYFGVPLQYRDLGGVTTTYVLDYKQEVTSEFANAVHGDSMNFTSIPTYPPAVDNGYQQFPVVINFTTRFTPSPKHVIYVRHKGLLTEVNDVAYGKFTFYTYDSEHRLTNLTVMRSDAVILKTTSQTYDEVGREYSSVDTVLTATNYYTRLVRNQCYDPVHNRRFVGYLLDPAGYASICRSPSQEWYDWFVYDTADRPIVVSGSLLVSNGQYIPTITPGKGFCLQYRNNQRISEYQLLPNGYPITTTLTYDANDALYATYAANGYQTIRSHLAVDAYSCIEDVYQEIYFEGTSWHNNVQRSYQDRNGREIVNSLAENENYTHTTVNTFLAGNTVPTAQQTTQYDPKSKDVAVNTYVIYYQYMDEPAPYYAKGTRVINGNTNKTTFGDALMLYSPNGMVNGKRLTADERNYVIGLQSDVSIGATHDGILFNKQLVFPPNINDYNVLTAYTKGFYFFTDVHGHLIGQYSALAFPVGNYFHKYTHLPVNCPQHPIIGDVQFPAFQRLVGKVIPPDPSNAPANPAANFFTVPSLQPEIYIVQEGDTFASIARQFCGEQEFADDIAKKNAYLFNEKLAPGMVLFLPSYIPMKNKADNNYSINQFLNIIQGSVLPFLPNPKIHQSIDFFRILGRILIIGIALIAASYLAPYLIGYLGIATEALLAHFITAVTTALAEAAAQGVAIKFGWQKTKFSIAEALEAGFTAGYMQGPMSVLGDVEATLKAQAIAIVEIGGAAATAQLLEMKLGLRKKFDPGALASQIASMIIGAKLDNAIKLGNNPELQTGIRSVTKTFANTLSSAIIQHTPIDAEMFAVNALGSVINDELSEVVQEKMQKNPETQKTTHTPKPESHYKQQRNAIRQNVSSTNDNAAVDIDPDFTLPDASLDTSQDAINKARAQRWQQQQSKTPTWAGKANVSSTNNTNVPAKSNESWLTKAKFEKELIEASGEYLAEKFNKFAKRVIDANENKIYNLQYRKLLYSRIGNAAKLAETVAEQDALVMKDIGLATAKTLGNVFSLYGKIEMVKEGGEEIHNAYINHGDVPRTVVGVAGNISGNVSGGILGGMAAGAAYGAVVGAGFPPAEIITVTAGAAIGALAGSHYVREFMEYEFDQAVKPYTPR